MEHRTLDVKINLAGAIRKIGNALDLTKKYATIALAGSIIALSHVYFLGCGGNGPSDCCQEMYDKGECKLSLPSGCDEYGTKCVDHDSGSCSCEEYQKTCKPLAAIDEYEDITDIVDILE